MDFQTLLKLLGGRQNANQVGTNLGPFYGAPGEGEVGGSVQLPFGLPQVGGTVGVADGSPFANANVNHQPVNFAQLLQGLLRR